MSSTLIEHINNDMNKLTRVLKSVYTYTLKLYMFRPIIWPSDIRNTYVRYIKNRKLNFIYIKTLKISEPMKMCNYNRSLHVQKYKSLRC
jgi:hypothetical protein